MFLRCKGCGKEMMLGKTFMHDWHNVRTAEEKGKELADFIQEHGHCCDWLETDTCGGINPFDDAQFEPFELTYESQDDWGERKTLQQLDKELHPEKYDQKRNRTHADG